MEYKNLMSDWRAPYVHSSNFNNLIGVTAGYTNITNSPMRQRFDALMRLRNQLYDEAHYFTEETGTAKIIKKINDYIGSYSKIALKILEEQDLETNMLVAGKPTVSQLREKSENLGEVVKNILDDNKTEIMEDILTAIEYEVDKSIDKTKTSRENLNTQITALNKMFGEKTVSKFTKTRKIMYKNKSSYDKMIKKALFSAADIDTTKDMKDAFINKFKDRFRNEIKARGNVIIADKQTPEEYLKEVTDQIGAIKKLTPNTPNLRGDLGEIFAAIVVNSDHTNGNQLNIQVIAQQSENQLLNKNSPFYGTVRKLITHHDNTKESQTDLIFTNSKGKHVRVQAKNLASSYRDIVRDSTLMRTGVATIQSETEYISLIERLLSTNHLFTEEDAQILSYLLANYIWYNAKGSYYKIRDDNFKPGDLKLEAEKVLSLAVADLMGLESAMLTQDVLAQSAAAAGNVFYMIANNKILPTFMILDDLIELFNGINDQIATLKIKLNEPTINVSAKDFFKQKQSSTILKHFGNYDDSALLEVGKNMGQEIIGNLMVSRISLNIDMNRLFTKTAYFES